MKKTATNPRSKWRDYALGMDQTQTTAPQMPTREQMAALRRHQQQRLRDQAEAMLRALELMEPPKTPVEAERSIKALLAVDKLFNALDASEAKTATARPAREADGAADVQRVREVAAIMDRRLGDLVGRRLIARFDEARHDEKAKIEKAKALRRGGG